MSKITTNKIRKELAILINQKKLTCKTEAEENRAVGEARKEINDKYGKGWRESYPSIQHRPSYNYNKPSFAQDLGDEWDDYAWSGDDF